MSILQLLKGLTFAALLFVVASGFTLILGCCVLSILLTARSIRSSRSGSVLLGGVTAVVAVATLATANQLLRLTLAAQTA